MNPPGPARIDLLVGAARIANTMAVTVLERRGEIRLRRSRGARPSHIGTQFITEAAVLALIGRAIAVLVEAAVGLYPALRAA